MDTMTPEQRRAHLILIGQTLLDEWTARCRSMQRLWANPDMPHENYWRAIENLNGRWGKAVKNELGPDSWYRFSLHGGNGMHATCTLSNGEVYEPFGPLTD